MNLYNSEPDPALFGLEWTGERYLPEISGEMALEHLHRYAMAKELAGGKIVLDIASGEGYGSRLLSEAASHVFGVDLSTAAVEHSNRKYGRENLEFRVGSCAEIPLASHSVDLVVSFETIEHHDQHEEMMGEIKRVLRPDGLVIISSPEKHEYSIAPNYTNEYHVHELFRDEFEGLMARYFKSIAMFGQRIVYGSGILLENACGPTRSFTRGDFENGPSVGLPRPLYLIALASDAELPALVGGLFEADIKESEAARKMLLMIEDRERHIEALERKIELIMHSHSWKLTAPLRFAQDYLAAGFPGFVKSLLARIARLMPGKAPPRN